MHIATYKCGEGAAHEGTPGSHGPWDKHLMIYLPGRLPCTLNGNCPASQCEERRFPSTDSRYCPQCRGPKRATERASENTYKARKKAPSGAEALAKHYGPGMVNPAFTPGVYQPSNALPQQVNPYANPEQFNTYSQLPSEQQSMQQQPMQAQYPPLGGRFLGSAASRASSPARQESRRVAISDLLGTPARSPPPRRSSGERNLASDVARPSERFRPWESPRSRPQPIEGQSTRGSAELPVRPQGNSPSSSNRRSPSRLRVGMRSMAPSPSVPEETTQRR